MPAATASAGERELGVGCLTVSSDFGFHIVFSGEFHIGFINGVAAANGRVLIVAPKVDASFFIEPPPFTVVGVVGRDLFGVGKIVVLMTRPFTSAGNFWSCFAESPKMIGWKGKGYEHQRHCFQKFQ